MKHRSPYNPPSIFEGARVDGHDVHGCSDAHAWSSAVPDPTESTEKVSGIAWDDAHVLKHSEVVGWMTLDVAGGRVLEVMVVRRKWPSLGLGIDPTFWQRECARRFAVVPAAYVDRARDAEGRAVPFQLIEVTNLRKRAPKPTHASTDTETVEPAAP